MREISAVTIEKTVEELFLKANAVLPKSLENKIRSCENLETTDLAKGIFCDISGKACRTTVRKLDALKK